MSRPVIEAFLTGKSSGPLSLALRCLLAPLALTYGIAGLVRQGAYARGLVKPARLPIPVISVGNLTVGGTGKTPFVRMLAARLVERGIKPLVLSRGYGATTSDGLDEEGASLQRDLPEVRILQAPDRFGIARPHLDDLDVDLAILDDGAQATRFGRDLDIFLVDAIRPFGAGLPLPAGSLREFPEALRRADLVVVTRSGDLDEASRLELIERLIAHGAPEGRIIFAIHAPSRFGTDSMEPGSLSGRRVFLISAIANPGSFEATVEGLGASVKGHRRFNDHHAYSEADLRAVDQAAVDAGAELILCTGKDEPKLRSASFSLPLSFLEVTVRLLGNGEELLDAALNDLGFGADRPSKPQHHD